MQNSVDCHGEQSRASSISAVSSDEWIALIDASHFIKGATQISGEIDFHGEYLSDEYEITNSKWVQDVDQGGQQQQHELGYREPQNAMAQRIVIATRKIENSLWDLRPQSVRASAEKFTVRFTTSQRSSARSKIRNKIYNLVARARAYSMGFARRTAGVEAEPSIWHRHHAVLAWAIGDPP